MESPGHHQRTATLVCRRFPRGPKGIDFSSLECDDRFTSANWFGMQYQVVESRMLRCFEFGDNSAREERATTPPVRDYLSVREQDYWACIYNKIERRSLRKYQFTSDRMPNVESSNLVARVFHPQCVLSARVPPGVVPLAQHRKVRGCHVE